MDRLLQHRAFEIVEPTDDFDPNFKPEDGIQYLQQVAHERSRCPEVVICPFQDSSESVISSFSPSAQTSNDKTKTSIFAPTIEWIDIQIDTFSKLLESIAKIRLVRTGAADQNESVSQLPNIDDEQKWMTLCRQRLPLLSTMLRIDQRTLERLIEYLQDCLQTLIITDTDNNCELERDDKVADEDEYTANSIDWIIKWLYASLACLRQPLEPTMHHLLREIVRACKLHRDALSPSSSTERAAPLNLLICIICFNYQQFDLADI